MFSKYDRISLGYDSSGRPLVINRRTRRMLRAVERVLGIKLTITQGSYMGNGAAASAGTHDGGGTVDLRVWDLPKHVSRRKVVRVLREHGFAAWLRTEEQGFDEDHIHAVAIGDRDLAPVAARQVIAYRQGRNGLRDNGFDDGPRVGVITWEQAKRRRKPRTLRPGATGYWVREAQRRLLVPIDGHFGPLTARAVRQFRRKHNIRPITSNIGRRVWRKLL